ncbi:hypothetical protein AV649_14810 [Rossellomorea marisflavi]|uniref:Uncharacterized protein n=2 Tax=Bacillaceae TaxID=186817 RepID=A0A163LQG2_9BACI|nr:hypothetical protein AV649_14810 [Rossellomorea marisflavi]
MVSLGYGRCGFCLGREGNPLGNYSEEKAWKRAQKMGKVKYLIVIGILTGGGAFFGLSVLLAYTRGADMDLFQTFLSALSFGVVYGYLSWKFTKRRYEKKRG